MDSYSFLPSLLLMLIGLGTATPKKYSSVPTSNSIIDSSISMIDLVNHLNISVIDEMAGFKYLMYNTSENRLVFPPGTSMYITPTIQLPVARNLPIGLGSHMTVSIPFGINFDDLGLTSLENPWGLWPEFNLAGGEREVMFMFLEDALSKLGISGKACLLRTICETFETPLLNHGFLAELMELFFSVSKSSKADKRLAEYLEAENLGKHNKSCSKFYSGCASSLFSHNGQNRSAPTRDSNIDSNSRSKRFIHNTSENSLSLPPGTVLVLTPTIDLPVARNLPIGLGSQITISIPFSINFDDLGLTSEENPWGLWPEIDRDVIFMFLEDVVSKMGHSGRPCLLRAICELFETPLLNHGFLGDVMELFFSVSKSPHADKRMADYLEAENLGKHGKSCSKFYSGCENSIFSHNGQNNWKQPDENSIENPIQNNSVEKEDPTWGLTKPNS